MINGIYPVQVELLSGQFKGRVGWAPVTVVSPVPGKRAKPTPGRADKGNEEIQKTIARRKKRSQLAQARNNAQAALDAGPEQARDPEARRDQLQAQLQLQMLQQQAAIAESQLASQAQLNQQLARTLRQRQLSDSYRNGGGVVFGQTGAMTMDEYLRSLNP